MFGDPTPVEAADITTTEKEIPDINVDSDNEGSDNFDARGRSPSINGEGSPLMSQNEGNKNKHIAELNSDY